MHREKEKKIQQQLFIITAKKIMDNFIKTISSLFTEREGEKEM